MQKSKQVNIYLPKILITGIDEYLAHTCLDIGRSALLKFCLTYQPKLTKLQRQQAIRLQDDLYRGSNNICVTVSLRCHYKLADGSGNITKICNTLTFLNLNDIFNV